MCSHSVIMPQYSQIDTLMQQVGAEPSAAELHGLMCGFLCGGIQLNPDEAIRPILGAFELNDVFNSQLVQLTKDLYTLGQTQLHDQMYDMQLLLPSDEDTLIARSVALSQWCQGFLYGLGLAGIAIEGSKNGEVLDIYPMLAEIAKYRPEEECHNEENEKAYAELVEYVRLAVCIIHREHQIPPYTGDSGSH